MYTYILPPIRYPDGRTYVKFGQHDLSRELDTRAGVTRHYRTGPDPGHVRQLVDQARQLVPGLRLVNYHGDSCVTLNTPSKEAPYIDNLLPGISLNCSSHLSGNCKPIFRTGHCRSWVRPRRSEL